MSQSQGDILAQADGYVEPCGSDFAFRTWLNEFISKDTQIEKAKRVSQECAEAAGPTGITCSIFEDTFSVINPADWSESPDPENIATPGVNGYEHIVHGPLPQIYNANVTSQGLWNLGGDFDITVEVDIYGTAGLSPIALSKFFWTLQEGVKGGENIFFSIENNNGIFQYKISGGGPSVDYPTTFGIHYLRIARSGTTVTAWVWNSSLRQWEWNGNTAGRVHDGVWDLNPNLRLQWSDTNNVDYIEGTIRKFCINAGSRV